MVTAALVISNVLLWIAVVAIVVAVMALYHHFGSQYLSSRERRMTQGPRPGTALAPVDTPRDGGSAPRAGTRALILFASTSCRICERLKHALNEIAVRDLDLDVLAICRGDLEKVERWSADLHQGIVVVPDKDGSLLARYDVDLTPHAVAVSSSGAVTASALVNDSEGMEAILSTTLHPLASSLDPIPEETSEIASR